MADKSDKVTTDHILVPKYNVYVQLKVVIMSFLALPETDIYKQKMNGAISNNAIVC